MRRDYHVYVYKRPLVCINPGALPWKTDFDNKKKQLIDKHRLSNYMCYCKPIFIRCFCTPKCSHPVLLNLIINVLHRTHPHLTQNTSAFNTKHLFNIDT